MYWDKITQLIDLIYIITPKWHKMYVTSKGNYSICVSHQARYTSETQRNTKLCANDLFCTQSPLNSKKCHFIIEES
jgi:hypothetical protein